MSKGFKKGIMAVFTVFALGSIAYFDVENACFWAMGITYGWVVFKCDCGADKCCKNK